MRLPPLAAAVVLASLLSASAGAQDPFSSPGVGSQPQAEKDESTPDYLKALEMQRKGKWKESQKAFQDLLKKYPNSVHAHDCEMRGGLNCYLGCEKLWESGPPARRIDVSVMGDGFQIENKQQEMERDWARQCLDVLDAEYAYAEYKDYFNYYFVRLVSKDQGVDEVLSDEELKKRQEKDKNKKKKKPYEFNTALDCKAAGPQKQVMSDHSLVYEWLAYANGDAPGCGDDGLVIVFARFGQLGMAELGNGLANCGEPSKSVTVHEFGHAFVGLLDEYAVNPSEPGYPIRAINATTDPKDLPWQHFIDKKVKGVGAVLGGATYQKGVWRPCATCAMNSAGSGGAYCPVCREAAILRIYATVNPIDKTSHDPFTEIKCVAGDETQIAITPMQPRTHSLKCEWYVDRVPDSEPGPKRPQGDGTTSDGTPQSADGSGASAARAFQRKAEEYDYPPLGQVSDLGKVEPRTKSSGTRFLFPAGKLGRGRWVVTCRVWDPCEYVLKDTKHLLEERETFWVVVAPKK
jgi:IgA peptidase M64